MSEPVIEVDGVAFSYPNRGRPWRRSTLALDAVSFALPRGSVCGVVGHNGAGKTTLLLLLGGFKSPSAGSVRVLGKAAADRSLLGRVGLLTDRLVFYHRFRVGEVVKMFALAYRGDLRRVDWLGLENYRDTSIQELSAGLRKRLSLVVATMHDPDVILLDEPFAGLDPESLGVLIEVIAKWRADGRTVVVSSHDLPELESVMDEIVVLRYGKSLAAGNFRSVIESTGLETKVTIHSSRGVYTARSPREVRDILDELEGDHIEKIVTSGSSLSDLYRHLHAAQVHPDEK